MAVKKTINLSVNSVNDSSKTLEAATIISVGPARGHTYEGMQVYADEVTLSKVVELINASEAKPYVNLDHSAAVGSKIGRILDAKVLGAVVQSSLHFLEVAFSESMNRIGDYIFNVAKEDSDLIGCSLEMETDYEVIADKAFLRPTSVLGVSIVNDPAFQTKLALFNGNPINTNKETQMAEEIKKDEVQPEVAKVETPIAAEEKPEVAVPEAKPEGAKPEETKPEEVKAAEPTLADVIAKIDALQALLAPLMGIGEEMKASKAALEAKTVEAEALKAELSKKSQTVKLSATTDVEVVSVVAGPEKLDLQKIKTDPKYYAENKVEYFKYLRSQAKVAE